MTSQFWWGKNSERKRVPWMSWQRMGVSKFHGGMGFRDLEIFNKALLAKQGWRILKFPNSLVAKILQEKYFQGGDFLKAPLGRRSSYAWRSIVHAREVLERGLEWRVGDGARIRIWGDKWLPPPNSILVHLPQQSLAVDSRVIELIDPRTRWWNFDLIRANFDPWEAGQICSLPLSPLGQPDQIVWQGTKNRYFTVKSAYYMEMQHRNCSKGESSTRRQNEGVWKTIWTLSVPPVLKNFAWKVCQNILPTKANLFSKKIVQDLDLFQ
jgi:hypothetical protein